jgi:hypothetical protein
VRFLKGVLESYIDAGAKRVLARSARLGAVRVPDERIDTLSNIVSPKKPTYAEREHATRGKKVAAR